MDSFLDINSLPDLCLIVILDHLPLSELVSSRLVCARWYELYKSVCHRKISLRIDNLTKGPLIPGDEKSFYRINGRYDVFVKIQSDERNSSLVSHKNQIQIKETNARMLSITFPKIKHLVILTNTAQFDTAALLSYWPGLISLKLLGTFDWPSLRDGIESLQSLKRLSVDCSVTELSKMTIASRLEQFYCRFGPKHRTIDEERMKQLSTTLNSLVTDNVQQFGLWIEDHTDKFERFSNDAIKRITRLTIQIDSIALLKWICCHMESLSYLDLEFVRLQRDSPLLAILFTLSSLKQLAGLRLAISKEVQIDEEDLEEVELEELNSERRRAFGDQFELLSRTDLPQLAALKWVEMKFPLSPHQIVSLKSVIPNFDQLKFRLRIFTDQFKSFNALLADCFCLECDTISNIIRQCQEDDFDSVLIHFKSGSWERTQFFCEYLDY